MSESSGSSGGVKPWPGWVRYTLLAVLFGVVGIGLVVALYDKGILPIAGPFVVLFLLPVLLPLRRRGLRNRCRRLATRLDERLAGLAVDLGQERSLTPDRRDSAAGDDALASAAARVEAARQQLATGQDAAAVGALAELSRMVSTSWRRGAPLTRDVAAAAGVARRLERVRQQSGQAVAGRDDG